MATSQEPPDDTEVVEGDKGAEMTEGLHGVINTWEACRHVCSLDETLGNMDMRVKEGEVKDVLKDTITQFKNTISLTVPQVVEADVAKVIHSVSDFMCLVLRPRMEEREQMLEMVMPLENVPCGDEVTASIEETAMLTDNQQDLLQEVFEDLEVTHKHTGRACSSLAWLSLTLNSTQLMVVLRAQYTAPYTDKHA